MSAPQCVGVVARSCGGSVQPYVTTTRPGAPDPFLLCERCVAAADALGFDVRPYAPRSVDRRTRSRAIPPGAAPGRRFGDQLPMWKEDAIAG